MATGVQDRTMDPNSVFNKDKQKSEFKLIYYVSPNRFSRHSPSGWWVGSDF